MSEFLSRLPVATLNANEQQCLLQALTSALDLCDMAGLRGWARGPLQALLPHRVLVCVRLGSDGEPLRIECLHGDGPAPSLHAALCDPAHGLAMAAYRLWRPGTAPLPLHEGGQGQPVPQRLAALGLSNALAHGTPTLPGGSTFFLLAGLPARPAAHHAQLLRFLLPHLHLALQRVCVGAASAVPRALSPREAQVLRWLREGKSNDEIGIILGISGLTVKNHLQRLYKLLGVSNRAHAVARSDGLVGH